VMSASGRRIAFSAFEQRRRAVYVTAPGGTPERVCDDCLRATDWSRDEKTIMVFAGAPYRIETLVPASRQRTTILSNANYNLLYARYSPDNRWVSFTVRTQPGQGRIMIAPLDGPKPVPEAAWIRIADVTGGDWANWSADGSTLYFTSGRDGHNCFWGQRLDVESRMPVNEPFPVLHLHGRLYYEPGANWAGWSVRRGQIAMALGEDTGNIWMLSPDRSR
jgi:Tol biopolymer transport system component